MKRRDLMAAILAGCAAPAIVKADRIMRIDRKIIGVDIIVRPASDYMSSYSVKDSLGWHTTVYQHTWNAKHNEWRCFKIESHPDGSGQIARLVPDLPTQDGHDWYSGKPVLRLLS